MTPDEARTLLDLHCGPTDDPRSEQGFLGMLRPYRGRLREESFHEVMACVAALAEELSAERLDRATVASLWGICHFGRAWGVDEDGMLRRNQLIAAKDVKRLAEWIDCISYATAFLLGGAPVEDALEPYRQLQRR